MITSGIAFPLSTNFVKPFPPSGSRGQPWILLADTSNSVKFLRSSKDDGSWVSLFHETERDSSLQPDPDRSSTRSIGFKEERR